MKTLPGLFWSLALACAPDALALTFDNYNLSDVSGKAIDNASFTLCGMKGLYAHGSEGTYESKSSTPWCNAEALNEFNAATGQSLTDTQVQTFTAPNTAGSHSTITLPLPEAPPASYVFYLIVGANGGTLSSLTVTGLSDISYRYAVAGGTGFSDVADADASGTLAISGLFDTAEAALVRLTGTLADGATEIRFASATERNGFGVISAAGLAAAQPVNLVPEPSTATLSLLALTLLLRRRRR